MCGMLGEGKGQRAFAQAASAFCLSVECSRSASQTADCVDIRRECLEECTCITPMRLLATRKQDPQWSCWKSGRRFWLDFG
jgi:hypothetical protein